MTPIATGKSTLEPTGEKTENSNDNNSDDNKKRPGALTGPKGHPLFGNLHQYADNKLGFLEQCAREYGDFVPLRFGHLHAMLVSDPDAIEQILVTNYRNFIKAPALRRSIVLFGRGLLTSEGDFWRRQRKLTQPAFHRDRIAAYAQIMVDDAATITAQWEDGQVCDIYEQMMRLTLKIALKTLFGTEVGDASKVYDALETAQTDFARWIHYIVLLPDWIPTPQTGGLRRAIRELDSIVYKIIHDRRESGEDRGDLLSMLLRVQDEDDGSYMTDRQLRDEILTLFLAGHDTTALTLTWTLYLLSQNPDREAKLLDELSFLNGRPPTLEDRPHLKYTEQVIIETMRLYPPAWTLGRTALADCTVGGHPVKAGTTLILSQWVMHRDPRHFPDPEAFQPERWDGDFAKTLPKYAYFPFGGGPRICIGSTFAMMELALVLATILPDWKFRHDPDQPIELMPSVTLRARHGVKGTLSRR